MSKLQQKRQFAAARGCFIHRRSISVGYYQTSLDKWDVYIESEGPLGPRDLALTRREAIAMAYRISICKHQKLTITVD